MIIDDDPDPYGILLDIMGEDRYLVADEEDEEDGGEDDDDEDDDELL